MTQHLESREPRDGYAEGLVEIGAEHDDVFVLDGDCAKANYTTRFQEKFPDRFFNLGIAECDIVGTAAGQEVAVGVMRALPEMTVIVPCDAVEMRKAVHAVHALDGPVYLRVGKLPVPVVTDEDTPFEIGKAVRLREGDDVTLLTTGSMASETLGAADLLAAEGVKAEVLHLHTIKPLDAEAVIASVTKTGCAVTAEEHSVVGGLGSAVAEVLSEHLPAPLERVGTKDTFGLSGTMDELFDYFGLRAANIAQAARAAVERRS